MSMQADLSRFDTMRRAMVSSQLRTSAVNDPRVVEAMAVVPREQYVPEAVQAICYRDTQLPLGGGRAQNAPLATGRLLTEASIQANDRVLLIGAAGGYTAAVLSMLAGGVVAVEEDPALAASAREALAGFANVELVEAPLAKGWAKQAPYDAIVVDGAVEHLPGDIVEQAKVGGRITTGLVDRGVTRLAMGTRTEGGFGLFDFADVDCVVLPGFARPRTFRF